jgi:hypothetical protein
MYKLIMPSWQCLPIVALLTTVDGQEDQDGSVFEWSACKLRMSLSVGTGLPFVNGAHQNQWLN